MDGKTVVVPIKPRSTFTQGDLLRSVALNGGGVVRLADFHIGADIRAGSLVPVLDGFRTTVSQPIYLIYSNRRNLSPRIKAFIEFFERKISENPWNC